MTVRVALPTNLADWLSYIEALHPKSIAMGLDRVDLVKSRLHLNPNCPVIMIGGTNGKGSTCAMLERIYVEAGYKVGCYTSPHLVRYNERVRINGVEINDKSLVDAFLAIEAARNDVELTYFEFGTLAAIKNFIDAEVDVMILEVGLGGRLDAVNAFDPDCSVVVSVDLDHMEFLGNNRELIGFEKAGIFRPEVVAICGDIDPPKSLIEYAQNLGANLKLIGKDFNISPACEENEDLSKTFNYQFGSVEFKNLPSPALDGDFQLLNTACVLTAVEVMQNKMPVPNHSIISGLQNVQLSGRFQKVHESPEVIFDVAHNPHAVRALVKSLNALESKKTLAVFAMLGDKDIQGVIETVKHSIDCWYIAGIQHSRAASAEKISGLVNQIKPKGDVKIFVSVADALRQACLDADENDRIIVFGSFFTVSDAIIALPVSI